MPRKKVPSETIGGSPPVALLETEVSPAFMDYLTLQDKQRIRRQKNRYKALKKIAGDSDPKCVVCGCPHIEVLQIGFKKHREGRYHRRPKGNSRNVLSWVLSSPIEGLRELVHIICPFCNAWHNKFKNEPPEYKRPRWSSLAF